MTSSSNDDLFSFSLARIAINDFLSWKDDSLKKTCDSSLKTSLTWTYSIASSTSLMKFNLSILKVKRSTWKFTTDWSSTSSSMIKNTLQIKHQQKRFKMLWATNTKWHEQFIQVRTSLSSFTSITVRWIHDHSRHHWCTKQVKHWKRTSKATREESTIENNRDCVISQVRKRTWAYWSRAEQTQN